MKKEKFDKKNHHEKFEEDYNQLLAGTQQLLEELKKKKLTEQNKQNSDMNNDNAHIGLLVQVKQLLKKLNDSSSNSYASASESTELPDSSLRTATPHTFFKQPAANHSNLETPTTTFVLS